MIPLYEEVVKMFSESLPHHDYEILFIDNKSTDSTRDKIRYLCSQNKNIRAILTLGILATPTPLIMGSSVPVAIAPF